MPGNAILLNFTGGETSPKSRGRFDLPWYASSARKMLNFIPEITGAARYRPGFRKVRETRNGNRARLFQFQLGNTQGYMLEFSDSTMRVYMNGDLLTSTEANIVGIANGAGCTITVDSVAGLANGNAVLLSQVLGMPEVNGRQAIIANLNAAARTFQVKDVVTGALIDSTSFGLWSSGGLVDLVVEIASPYLDGDLDTLQGEQNNTTAYFENPGHVEYKLTVDSANNFTLAAVTYTASPFSVAVSSITVTNIVLGTTTYVTFTKGDVINEDTVYTFTGVVGTAQIMVGVWRLKITTKALNGNPRGILYDPQTGLKVNSGSSTVGGVAGLKWTAYVSGGSAGADDEYPIATCFYEGRRWVLGTNQRPDCLFASRAPDSDGNPRYDDFTGGSADDDACFFELSPVSGQTDVISWGRGTNSFLFLGTNGGPFRVTGTGVGQPITPSSIDVKQIDGYGCEPVLAVGSAHLFWIQRGGVSVRTPQLINPYLGTFETNDLCLNAEHMAYSPFKRLALTLGRPDILYAMREDGVLCGMTVKITEAQAESISGWSRTELGGAGKVIDVQPFARANNSDQLWLVSERVLNGVTRRFVEYQADDVPFPDPEDFYSGPAGSKDADLALWLNAVYRQQEQYIHLDASATYNGSDRGNAAAAALTLSAVTGNGVVVTASAPVFNVQDVGQELWHKPNVFTGIGAGRAQIKSYISATQVTVDVLVDFDAVGPIQAGDWFFAVKKIYGIFHLEGTRVAVVTDGGVYSDGRTTGYPTVTVLNGSITLPNFAGVAHVGLPYSGFLQSHNLEMGGKTGPAQAKQRNISEMFIRFMNTLGVDYGTDLYKMEKVHHRPGNAISSRPAPVFSGIRKLPYSDRWEGKEEKRAVVSQQLPLPAIVQFLDLRYDTSDDAE